MFFVILGGGLFLLFVLWLVICYVVVGGCGLCGGGCLYFGVLVFLICFFSGDWFLFCRGFG